MQLIRTDKIIYKYDEQIDILFQNVSLEINSDSKIGLIGKNGCGKSTLMNILRKKLTPLSGSIYFKDNLTIGFLPQELDLPEHSQAKEFLYQISPEIYNFKQKINNIERYNNKEIIKILSQYDKIGGYEFELKLEKVTTKFGFNKDMLNRNITSLSGGERTKLALCRILLQEQDVLLLDEPTNHLDIDSLKWLEEFLKSVNIPYLIISHDRKFLDNSVGKILELSKDGIKEFSGNYSFYKEEKERELNRKILKYGEQKSKINKLKTAMEKRKKWAFTHQVETRNEGYAPIYEQLSNFAKSAMKRAINLKSRLNKLVEMAEEDKPFIEKERKFYFNKADIKSRFVLRLVNISISYNSLDVLKDINISVKNGERLAIIGKNGSGKSTLLKIITNNIDSFEGRYYWSPQVITGYYSQNYTNLSSKKTVIEEVGKGDKEKQTFARTILACLNISSLLINKKIDVLSIGEKSKVALAKIIVSGANVLVLDEPTNHLEISARESLEDALRKYDGTIIFATHDRFLIDNIAHRILNLSENRLCIQKNMIKV